MQSKKLNIHALRVAAFDWDNTLAYTRDALVWCINAVLKEYNLPTWDKVKNYRDSNLSFRDNFPLIFGKKADEAYDKYVSIYKKHALSMIRQPKDADKLLSLLKENNIAVVLVTNKDRQLLEFELPFFYTLTMFDKIVCGHEAFADKPHPQQLQDAVQGVIENITPLTTWMVGDSDMDQKCACAAGATFVRIGQPIWGEKQMDSYKYEYCFSDFS